MWYQQCVVKLFPIKNCLVFWVFLQAKGCIVRESVCSHCAQTNWVIGSALHGKNFLEANGAKWLNPESITEQWGLQIKLNVIMGRVHINYEKTWLLGDKFLYKCFSSPLSASISFAIGILNGSAIRQATQLRLDVKLVWYWKCNERKNCHWCQKFTGKNDCGLQLAAAILIRLENRCFGKIYLKGYENYFLSYGQFKI